MILPINQLIDSRYIATRFIASGGMAEIYEANDIFTKKPVALKVIKDEFKEDLFEMERFENEARYASMFSHPHIITIYNVGKYKDNFFISYELMKGKTLKDILDERGKLTLSEAIDYTLQVLDGCRHIHGRGITHNDLKPENLFLFADGNVKLLDFGIATHLEEKVDKTNGSVLYVAPEVVRNRRYSIQSDIYSVGIIFYELLTGRTPYTGRTSEEIINARLNQDVGSVSQHISINNWKEIDTVIKKATNRFINQRYKSDQEMVDDLLKLKNGELLAKQGIFLRLFKK